MSASLLSTYTKFLAENKNNLFKPQKEYFSRAPDRDFHCFYPCVIFLSHLPVPARGKDKKTATRWPRSGRTLIRDVNVILNDVTSDYRIFLKPF